MKLHHVAVGVLGFLALASVAVAQSGQTNQAYFWRAIRNDGGPGFSCMFANCGFTGGFAAFSGDVHGGTLTADGALTAGSVSTGSVSGTDATFSTLTAGTLNTSSVNLSGPATATSMTASTGSFGTTTTGVLALTPAALPTCGASNAGIVAFNSADNQHWGCGSSGWRPLTNAVSTYVTTTGSYALPTSLGVLGVGGTTTAIVAIAGTPVGADCLITCPASALGKLVWQCVVATANTVTVVGTSTSAVAITLPSGQACSIRTFSGQASP